jgi:heat shock protein HslJ
MAFGPVVSTKMACDPGMELENAYFQALSKVERFSTQNGLVLSSADGKTSITLRMPPK